MRVALIGYGAVAAVHAAACGARLASVYGPDCRKAAAFAGAHGGRPETDLAKAFEGCDAAMICSPGPLHYVQALAALERVPAVLVELPACSNEAEAVALAEAAGRTGARLHCAHTSRYLEPFRAAGEWLQKTGADRITQVRYIRSILPRNRSWTDDALRHHAAHALDILRCWFGGVAPVALREWPKQGPPQDVALLAELPNGAPVSIAVSYVSRVADARMTLIGSAGMLETDGFSFVSSDRPGWNHEFEGEREYTEAIGRQDTDFLAGAGVPWTETIELVRLIDRFRMTEANR